MAADVILATPITLSAWHDETGLGGGSVQALKTEPKDRMLSGACCSWDHPPPPG